MSSLSEENKKGLRIIKTVLDIKGQKRFKSVKVGEQNAILDKMSSASFDFRKIDTKLQQ